MHISAHDQNRIEAENALRGWVSISAPTSKSCVADMASSRTVALPASPETRVGSPRVIVQGNVAKMTRRPQPSIQESSDDLRDPCRLERRRPAHADDRDQ